MHANGASINLLAQSNIRFKSMLLKWWDDCVNKDVLALAGKYCLWKSVHKQYSNMFQKGKEYLHFSLKIWTACPDQWVNPFEHDKQRALKMV